MCKEGNERDISGTEKTKQKRPKETEGADRKEKRGWGHIIDKDMYSDGPGDNIYVFG